MTNSDGPRPKLRVTLRNSAPSRPQEAHDELDTIDRDDKERSAGAELDDRFGFNAFKRYTADDELDFTRFSVALARNDVAREDDVFEVKDREVVIVKFFRSVERYGVGQRANTVSNSADRVQCNARIVADDSRSA